MITRAEITEIGTFNKPHGIQGEISASFLCDFDEIELLSCIIVDEDGIFVYTAPWAGWWGFAALTEADFKIRHEGADRDVELGAVFWTYFSK